MKALVVYYSRKGHTAQIAEQIAKELGAETDVIIDKKKRGGPFGFLGSGKDSMNDVPADIEEPKRDPAGYELVVVGTPIWAGQACTPARAYIRKFSGRFPEVAFFISCSGNYKTTLEDLAKMAGKAPKATLVVTNGEQKNGAHAAKVEEFVGKLRV